MKMHNQILIAMIAGLLLASLFSIAPTEPDQPAQVFSKWLTRLTAPLSESAQQNLTSAATALIATLDTIGDLFIRLLKMIIIPLIMASMVSGVVSIGTARNLRRIGLRTFAYYVATTLLAVAVGLILVNLIAPGRGVEIPIAAAAPPANIATPSPASILKDMVPANIFAAMASGKVLSVIIFSLLLGIACAAIGEKARPLASFFKSLNAVMLKITDWIMKLAPIGIFALVTTTLARTGPAILGSLAKYMLTVTLGLTLHACITLPIILIIFARISPIKFFRQMFSAVATAFSTASSAATLPITMECLEKKVGVPNKIAGFVLPLGATINMDGTALYEAVAAMFIAQAWSIQMTITQQLIIMLTAALASIGAAAIPGAGLVTMIIVLKAVNLPEEGIAMILVVDRLLDMCRTAVNVWGDACGTAVIAKLEEK